MIPLVKVLGLIPGWHKLSENKKKQQNALLKDKALNDRIKKTGVVVNVKSTGLCKGNNIKAKKMPCSIVIHFVLNKELA